MIDYHLVKLYLFYRLPIMMVLRLFVFLLLLALFSLEFIQGEIPRFSFFLLNLFIIHELFYRYKICRLQPVHSVDIAGEERLTASTLPVVAAYLQSETALQMVKNVKQHPQVQFLFERMGITPDDLPSSSATREQLLDMAQKAVQQLGGKYITSSDLAGAYFLLIEEQSRFLFTHKLKPEEMLAILSWTRQTFPYEETPRTFRIHVSGGGIGEALVSGWTLETQKYTQDFTASVLRANPQIIGREKEFSAMQAALLKNENNNILLIGEIGGGKEALVEKLALASFEGKTEQGLQFKKIYELMVGPLIAGATDRGNLEQRLQALIEEISHARHIMLYIPEFQNLLGSSSYQLDLSGALYPYLQDGHLPIIATMTEGAYKQYLEGKPLTQVFTTITVDSPSVEMVESMLMEKVTTLERKESVVVPYQALRAVLTHANRYNPESILPGSAITLLQDVISRVKPGGRGFSRKKILITEDEVIKQVEGKTNIVLKAPDEKEKRLLLEMEDKLHERVIGQERAVQVIAEAMRRIRSGVVTATRPTSFLFLGPTGVGKTETARALAELYYGGESKIVRLDMSEYSDSMGERRLLGAPPGQGDERGELTEKVKDNPHALVLLDEFEKANPRILDLFLQVLEDGRLTDNKGRTVSFLNNLIIATSNAGSEFIRQAVTTGEELGKEFDKKLLDYLQQQHIFKPELLNRFDDVVTFQPLKETEIAQIARIMMSKVKEHMSKQDIKINFDESLLTYLAQGGYDPQFGARPLRRFLQDTIESVIAKRILTGDITRGDTVTISASEGGVLHIDVSSLS